MKQVLKVGVFVLSIFVIQLSSIEVSMAIENPKFKLLLEDDDDDFELRRYEPMTVARVKVSADFDDASSRGFRILADYIFGNNIKLNSSGSEEIAMTAPVRMQAYSESIDATSPKLMFEKKVSQEDPQGAYFIEFMMPSRFSKNTLPKPVDNRVEIHELPAKLMAVHTYSGTWSKERYEEHLKILRKSIEKRNLEEIAEPIFARYNPPFIPWFLRTNEIWIEVKDDQEPENKPKLNSSDDGDGDKK